MLTSFIARSGTIASGAVGNPLIASPGVFSGNIGSGQIASGHLASGLLANITVTLSSGNVQSGIVASGAVQGFFGSTRNIASGTLGVFDFGSGAVIAGQLGSGSVLSGNIGSGILSSGMMASGFINALSAATIQSGQIITSEFASGAASPFAQGLIQWLSGGVGNAATVITQQTISGICAVSLSSSGNLQIAMASVSGTMPALGVVLDNVASGIQANVFQDGNFQSTAFSFSGYIGSLLFVGRSGQIVTSSGTYNSGGLQSGDTYQPIGWVTNSGGVSLSVTAQLQVVPGLISSGEIASGQVGWPLIGNAGVLSGNIGSGQISSGMLASGLLANIGGGSVSSGSIVTIDFSSGAVTPFAGGLLQWLSGFNQVSGPIAQENISGVRAVSLSQSGYLQMAMASVTTRMPCIGVVLDNVASGIQVNIWENGIFQMASAGSGQVVDFSGYLGFQLFVGRSGQVVTASGGWNSGGLQSGDIFQPIGFVVNSGAASLSVTSQLPFVPGLVNSGQIGSGQVGQAALSSGAVQSGQIGSGAVAPSATSLTWGYFTAVETISGFCPVAVVSGGFLARAQGGSGIRMPAVGVSMANYASGANVTICSYGRVTLTSGLYRLWSGSYGSPIWVSTSGDLMTPTQPTTATLSQVIGVALGSGLFVMPNLIMQSGAAAVQSGIL